MKKITILALATLLFSCSNEKKVEVSTPETDTKKITKNKADNSKIGRNNYAVVWNWKTTDAKLVEENALIISDEFQALWKEDIVENSYYNSNSKIDKLENLPNITFFLKTNSVEETENILNDLTIVKKGISEYTIYPVGIKWLGRNTEKINEMGTHNSYVAVWNTTTKFDDSQIKEKIDNNVKQQSDAILELWEEGTVENVYFDIEGTVDLNSKTDFVFFVNSKTEQEAKEICKSLPFAKENIASFQLLAVGSFWLGQYKK